MARNKFNSLEIELASSILYYDKKELENFFNIYDGLSQDSNIVLDGIFDLFVSYIKKFDGFSKDLNPKERRQKIIDDINLRNDQQSDKVIRESFNIWFEKVLNTEVPLELSEDILYHLIWEEYKKSIDQIDNSDVPFKEKLELRPKMPKSFDQEGIIYLDDIEVEDDELDITDYTTGLEEVDRVVKFAKTNFVVIAARPGVGKSLFMIQMAEANARNGVKSLLLSFEMGKEQINDRIINCFTGENIKAQHTDENGKVDKSGYKRAVSEIRKSRNYKPINDNLQLYVSKATSADSIITKIEDAINQYHYEAIFIDYLQLLKYNRMDEWSSLRTLTKELKNLAFRTNTLVVTGSQVSRSSTEKGLYLSDLFGSSTIEADTDIVIGLENPNERRQGETALINVKIMKNREGDLAEIKHTVDYSIGRLSY